MLSTVKKKKTSKLKEEESRIVILGALLQKESGELTASDIVTVAEEEYKFLLFSNILFEGLNELLELEFISARWEPPKRGGKLRRRLFKIEDAGIKAFQSERNNYKRFAENPVIVPE